MSTITREFTKEQLIEHLRSRIEHRKGIIANMHIDRGYRDYLKLELRSSEIALASLEAEERADPVAFINGAWTLVYYRPPKELGLKIGDKLYTAPPAPVVVPDEITFEKIAEITASQGYEYSINECICAASWWNACRAAMLQGADGNSPVITDGWVACSERMPETDGNYWGWWSESKRQGPVWFIKSELQAQFQSSEITHWMPLPAAPQQEKSL